MPITYAQANPQCDGIFQRARSAILRPLQFFKNNALKLSPFALVPAAAILGGDVGAGAVAGMQISGSVFVLNKSLDVIMSNARDVIPPAYIVGLIAGTTNLPELSATQASALFAGDPIFDVGAAALGSNVWNPTLLAPAIVMASTARAIKEGWIKEGEAIKDNPKAFFKVLKKVILNHDVIKQLGLAGVFLISAVLFQSVVRPQMKLGNYALLAPWLLVNTLILSIYFKSNTFNEEAKWLSAIEMVDKNQLERALIALSDARQVIGTIDELQDHPTSARELGVTPDQLDQLERTFKNILAVQENSDAREQALNDARDELNEIKSDIVENPRIAEWLDDFIETQDVRDIYLLLDMSGVTDSRARIPKVQKIRSIMKIIAGAAAIVAVAPFLDMGVANIALALPGWEKGWASFVFMSLITSLPELLGVSKLVELGQDRGATKTISDSNALNILLAKLAMLSAMLVALF